MLLVTDVQEIEALCKYHKSRAAAWYETVEAMVEYADRAFELLDDMLEKGLISREVFNRLQDAVMDIKSPGEAEDYEGG